MPNDLQSAIYSNDLQILVIHGWLTLITKLIFCVKILDFTSFIIFCKFIEFYNFFDMLIPTLNYQELKKLWNPDIYVSNIEVISVNPLTLLFHTTWNTSRLNLSRINRLEIVCSDTTYPLLPFISTSEFWFPFLSNMEDICSIRVTRGNGSQKNGNNQSNILSDNSMYLWETNLVISVPADGLAPNGARPSADTVMTFP